MASKTLLLLGLLLLSVVLLIFSEVTAAARILADEAGKSFLQIKKTLHAPSFISSKVKKTQSLEGAKEETEGVEEATYGGYPGGGYGGYPRRGSGGYRGGGYDGYPRRWSGGYAGGGSDIYCRHGYNIYCRFGR